MNKISTETILLLETLRIQAKIDALAKQQLTPDKYADYCASVQGLLFYHVETAIANHGTVCSELPQLLSLCHREPNMRED